MRLDFFIELKRRHVYRVAVAYGVVGWLLIEFCTQVFPVLHMPEWTEQLMVLAILAGFPLTLILAWAFELTPEGVRRTEPQHSPKARSRADHRRVGRMLDFTIIGVLVLALAIALWRPWLHQGAMEAASDNGGVMAANSAPNSSYRHSIAVLPFTNNSKYSDQRYFSDGLSESLIIALNQYPELTVISRGSSFKFRSPTLDNRQIGKQLNVAYLLEGSVSHAGDQVRIRAELVETTYGLTVWSHSYDRPFDNYFALQDSITEYVASALEVQLLRPKKSGAIRQTDRPPSGSLKAYNAYKRGNDYFSQNTEASIRKAIDAYKQAIDADSRYAAAYAMLSAAWTNLAASHDLGQARDQAFDQARNAAETSIALDRKLAAGYVARGYASESKLVLKDALADYQHALMLEPSGTSVMGKLSAMRGIAEMQAAFGNADAAVKLMRETIKRDPLNMYSYVLQTKFLVRLGKYDSAMDVLARASRLKPGGPLNYLGAEVQLLRGHAREAVRIGKSNSNEESRMVVLALASPAAGDHNGGERALQWIINHRAHVMAYQIAQVYAFRGDADQTFHWLDRAWRQRDSGLSELLFDPFFKPYYRDPRFAEICHKLGVPVPASKA